MLEWELFDNYGTWMPVTFTKFLLCARHFNLDWVMSK